MRLLIVDDQLATLKGLARKIDWGKNGITEVKTAQNAMEARLVFREGVPDVLLCDIEMPVESGIDLCRWIREQEYQTEVIFLTCHSDFAYAKEAIELGSIGYIVQPAPYEEIVAVVHKAMAAVLDGKRQKEALSKAKVYEDKKRYINQKLWKDYLLQACSMKTLLETVDVIDGEDELNLLLFQLLRWRKPKEDWEETQLNVILFSFLKDIFQEEEYCTAFASMESEVYALAIKKKNGKPVEGQELTSKLQYLNSIFDMYMPCACACYLAQPTLMEFLPATWEELMKRKEHNVACKAGIFTSNESTSENNSISFEQIKFWKEYLCINRSSKMEDKAREFLKQMLNKGILDAGTLMRFYQEFMQMLYQAEREEGGKQVSSLFDTEESMELYRNGMKSLDSMLALIHHITLAYNQQDEDDQKETVETIKSYINNHLNRNVKKDEIIGIVHLNTDYVTRLFKKETGMSIKSYIIQQKMLTARDLLQNTSFLVSYIAIRLGYSNFSHFAATYKKQFGISPSEEIRNITEESR